MKYDFVLFENAYNIENHYKDLCILASLLKEAGYNVAFADVFKEDKLCNVDGIPHIQLPIKRPSRYSELRQYREHHSKFINQWNEFLLDIYLYRVTHYLAKLSKAVYLGSWMMGLPLIFLFCLNRYTNFYLWGLRSITLLYWRDSIWSKGGLFSKCYYYLARNKSNLFIVVSNDLIKDEFLNNVGVPEGHIILRPERIINEPTRVKPSNKGELHLLTIGTLRPFKHVEFALDALRLLNNKKIYYTIAGRCKDDNGYELMISDRMSGVPNVTRINKYLDDEEYERLMSSCDALLLCDGDQLSCASNGTMSEALLHGKPIIAPNFNPFKYEVETFGVGALYEYENIDSLAETLLLFLKGGTEKYMKSLEVYQNGYLFKNVSLSLRDQIEPVG